MATKIDQAQEPAGATATAPEVATREPGDEPERKPLQNPRPWAHDNVAGVELSYYHNKEKRIYDMLLKFRDGKPSEEVRQTMKDNGFRWEPKAPATKFLDSEGAWVKPIGLNTQAQDRYGAEKTYFAVVDAIRQEKGVEAGVGGPGF